MSVLDNSAKMGARTVQPTDAQLAKIRQYDPGLYDVGLSTLLAHLHYFVIPLVLAETPNNNAKNSVALPALIPYDIMAVQHGCKSAAGTAATGDIHKSTAAAPTTYATIQNAATDIKTDADLFVSAAILDGSESVEYGGRVKLIVTGTGSGDVVGAMAYLHCFRQ